MFGPNHRMGIPMSLLCHIGISIVIFLQICDVSIKIDRNVTIWPSVMWDI